MFSKLQYVLLATLLFSQAYAKTTQGSKALTHLTKQQIHHVLTKQLEKVVSELPMNSLKASDDEPNSMSFQVKVHSQHLTPGKVLSKKANFPWLVKPIFFIGSDQLSEKWLQANAKKLTALHAQGFVVQLDNAMELKRLRLFAPNIALIPVQGDVLAQWLGISHYPVLISAHLIEQ